MISEEALAELRAICLDAKEMTEGGLTYILLPNLKLPAGCNPPQVDGLLCLQARDGYPTRLFLSQPVAGKVSNWATHRILDRTWHTWSWNNVSSGLRPAQILAEHLRAFR